VKAAYTVREAQRELGIGRSKLYEEIAANRLRARKLGKRTIILGDELQRYLSALPDSDIGKYSR
jgi:excisionase family DNA binding protein